MFTGIIEEIGSVVSVEKLSDSTRLTIRGPRVVSDAAFGHSIAVNGCCLTVTEFDETSFSADVMAESLDKTNLGGLSAGSPVNLERAVAVGQRLGGHIVQGHVDGTGLLANRAPSEHWEIFTFSAPHDILRYLVPKGSITISGTSLTVVDVDDEAGQFTVSLIPTTLAETNLGTLQIGDQVNLEIDVMAKYIERLLP